MGTYHVASVTSDAVVIMDAAAKVITTFLCNIFSVEEKMKP